MQRLEDKAFRTLSSSASASASSASASAASKRLLERGLSKLKAGRAKNVISLYYGLFIFLDCMTLNSLHTQEAYARGHSALCIWFLLSYFYFFHPFITTFIITH